MNHSAFQKKNRSFTLRLLAPVFILAVCLLIFFWGVWHVSDASSEEYIQSLQAAISRSATHSYAVEGRYPESLDYLCDHYGITWDPDRYLVNYEVNGMNRRPTISVIERGQHMSGKEIRP